MEEAGRVRAWDACLVGGLGNHVGRCEVERNGICLIDTSRSVFFSATILPVFLSRALYTFPKVPSPIFSSFSYWSCMMTKYTYMIKYGA